MQILKSELTQRFYAVGDNYKPGQKKQDITPFMAQVITEERERIIALLTKPQPFQPERMDEHQRISSSDVAGFSLNEKWLRAVIEP
jgi:hypothetical protein